jgi:5-methylcytosine-specific restriction endonuclease McrA
MKRSGFRKQSVEEVRAKLTAKRAKLAARPKVPKLRKKVSKVAKRAKLPTLKTMRNKCDALLTPIIKKMYPNCLLTGQPTEVAHHAIKKSTSSALRYYLPNLIPLTHVAHNRLHNDETLWTGRLIAARGMYWWNDLEQEKKKSVKVDIHWYIENYQRLKAIYESL